MSTLEQARPAEILLVEDNDNDVELTRLSFERSKFAVNLHAVPNGEECMNFLHQEGKYADKPIPDIILLDLNMPRMSGMETLDEIGKDPRYQKVPVVVLTSSKSDEDVLRAYKLRCSAYLIKPITFMGFTRMIQSFVDYWLALVILPPKDAVPPNDIVPPKDAPV